MEELTDREYEIYMLICNYVAEYHNFPTHRHLMRETSITSTSMTAYYIDSLVKKRYLLKKKVNGKHEYVIKDSVWMAPRFLMSAVRQDGKERVRLVVEQTGAKTCTHTLTPHPDCHVCHGMTPEQFQEFRDKRGY